MVIFMTLAYYGLSSYQKMESEYERDVNYLLNIISQAEREAVGNQTRSDEAKELGLAKKEQFIHDIKDPIISAEDRKLLLPKVVNEQQPLPLVDVADKQPVAAKPTPQVQMPKSTIRVEKQVTKSFAEMGYEAYVKGDMFEAQQHYQRHLQAFPQSKAARLGLAAIAAEHGESTVAIEYYQQVLKSDPNDVDALSGLAVIASNLNTQFFSLGDLQQLVRRHPNSAALQFALGNHYAQKQDWFLAQPAFFEAVRLEGQNPDYRLNLAISFDQLREYYEAITHYKIAIALASNENKDFQRASINQRVMDLERFLEQR
jgi:tetratricopeptide (TPR) repeat protein